MTSTNDDDNDNDNDNTIGGFNVGTPIVAEQLVFVNGDNEDDAELLETTRRQAFHRLQRTVDSLSEFEGWENISLLWVKDLEINHAGVIPINSLVLRVSTRTNPVVVIVPSSEKVDFQKIAAYFAEVDHPHDERVPTPKVTCSLVPPEDVEDKCGFPPKSVPPLGHLPHNLHTVLDVSLCAAAGSATNADHNTEARKGDNNNNNNKTILLGGGGHPKIGCWIATQTLLKMEGTAVADIIQGDANQDRVVGDGDDEYRHDQDLMTTLATAESHVTPPYFSVAPPNREEVVQVLQNEVQNPFTPQPVTIVGRINGIRRMASRLLFCDLAPPGYVGTGTKQDAFALPWRSVSDHQEMSVQLIAGKTFCKNKGELDGPDALRQLRVGQLVVVEGKTNVGNRVSLGNWERKRSFDIVIFDYRLLEDNKIPAHIRNNKEYHAARDSSLLQAEKRRVKQGLSSGARSTLSNHGNNSNLVKQQQNSENSDIEYLDLFDTFQTKGEIVIVDSLDGIQEFRKDIESLPPRINGSHDTPYMVGIDCEWKPTFMAAPKEAQPVLLLQMSIQQLSKVYLVDLQTLLRPCLEPAAPMNDIESAVSAVIEHVFTSREYLKVGFQVSTDFCRLAGSYPHVVGFRVLHGVSEVSSMARKTLQLSKIQNARQVTTSLSRLTHYLFNKPLNKEQQVSDWSIRPLSEEQQVYAALDAAVTPALFEKSRALVEAQWFANFQLGRTTFLPGEDPPFRKAIVSMRFVFLDNIENSPAAIRKLKAKMIVSEQYIVTQSWVAGEEGPGLPSLPPNNQYGKGGPYVDIHGISQMPSTILRLQQNLHSNNNVLQNRVGDRIGKSKNNCLEEFLLKGHPDFPVNTKLEYQQRAGYVEFMDAIALFVNMPLMDGGVLPDRGYPNVWLDEGQILTWFLREREWNGGNSKLGRKLLNKDNNVVSNESGDAADDASSLLLLFVRMGRGDFIYCGRCAAFVPTEPYSDWSYNKNNLVELQLKLLDWETLQHDSHDFQSMTSGTVTSTTNNSINGINSNNNFAHSVATMIIEGNIVGAMVAALKKRNTATSNQSIDGGLALLDEILASHVEEERIENPKITAALEMIKKLR